MILQELIATAPLSAMNTILEFIKTGTFIAILVKISVQSKSMKDFKASAVSSLKGMQTSVHEVSQSVRKLEIWIASHGTEFTGLVKKVDKVETEQAELFKAWNSFYHDFHPELENIKKQRHDHH
jgi:hypothetical protein